MEMTWGACDPSQPGVLSGRASGLGLAALCHHLVVAVHVSRNIHGFEQY